MIQLKHYDTRTGKHEVAVTCDTTEWEKAHAYFNKEVEIFRKESEQMGDINIFKHGEHILMRLIRND